MTWIINTPHVIPMKPSFSLRLIAISLFFFDTIGARAQAPRFAPPVLRGDGLIELKLSEGAGQPQRVEVSSDLRAWTEFLQLDAVSSGEPFTDRPGATRKFYRIVQTPPAATGFHLDGFEPAAALPGAEITLQGVFNVPAGDSDRFVRFGSAVAEVKAGSATELKVVVPEGAGSGPLRVLTATTNTESEEAFTVLAEVPIVVAPPPQMAAADFKVVNTFGPAS
jgi:hypothetical protein